MTFVNRSLIKSKDELNDFTSHLLARCCGTQPAKIVTLRNGAHAAVKGHVGEGFAVQFHSEDFSNVWNADGSNTVSKELDIIRF